MHDVFADEDLFVPGEDNFRLENRIRDITDGKRYRSAHSAAKRRLNLKNSDILLSLVINTDGVQVQERTGQSAWPIFATIAEVPAHRRFFSDKILNLALWSGEGKPPIGAMLRRVQEELDELNQSRSLRAISYCTAEPIISAQAWAVTGALFSGGAQILTKNGPAKVFLHVLGITADLPAKSMLRNAHGHNGLCGCSVCDIRGFSVPSGDGHCIAFIVENGEVVSKRTQESVLECANEAIEQGFAMGAVHYLSCRTAVNFVGLHW